MSKTDTFNAPAMNSLVDRLADMEYGKGGTGPGAEAPDTGKLQDTVRQAVQQTDYFKGLPPDVKDRMMVPNVGGPAFEGQGPPTGGPGGFYPGNEPMMLGGFQNPATDPSLRDSFFNPNDLASVINTAPHVTPQELLNIINFAQAIRQDYLNYVSANSGSDSGYFMTPRTIQNFNYTLNSQPQAGAVLFTADSKQMSANGNFLVLTDVKVTSDPTGSPSGDVVINPTHSGSIQVPTP
jgi:hypothetical protein